MEHDGQAEASRQEDTSTARQSAVVGAPAPERQADSSAGSGEPAGSRWRPRPRQTASRPPWRVEGMPDGKEKDQLGDHRGWSRFWWILLSLLVRRWRVIAGALTADRPKTRYPVTASARVMIGQRRLMPDRVWDLLMRTQFPTPKAPPSGAADHPNQP